VVSGTNHYTKDMLGKRNKYRVIKQKVHKISMFKIFIIQITLKSFLIRELYITTMNKK